jgi:hypothetical protein
VIDAYAVGNGLFGTTLDFASFFLGSVADAFASLDGYLLASFLFASFSGRSTGDVLCRSVFESDDNNAMRS